MHPLPSFGVPLHEHPSIQALGLGASDVMTLRSEIGALVRTLRDVFELAG